jgi:hypothetical protein
MITFSPIWHTDANLPDTIEGNPVALPLIAVATGKTTLPAGATELSLGIDVSQVTGVRFNGLTSSYTGSGMSLYFSALSASTAFEVETNVVLIYTLIGGKLPKGMFVSQQGILSGSPEGIRDEQGELFTFTVRVVNDTAIRDRTFRMLVHPVAQSAVWNMSGLPLESADSTLSTIPYRVLGEVKRGEAFSFSIDVAHPDGDTVTVAIKSSDGVLPRDTNFNGALPQGLKLVGTSIEGVVLPSTPPGRYFFTLSVVAPSAPAPIPVMIEVLSLRTTTFKRPVKMQWVTAAGSLGVLDELEICDMTLLARNPNGGAVNYNLLYGTGGLPPGLVLNPQTGDIEGQTLFVAANTSYSFTVRASSGSIFADRSFSIDIKDKFQAEDISEVSLKFQGRDRKMALRGYDAIIPSDWLYRPSDQYFGIVTEPYIHVARGLYPDATLDQLDYRENITCLFGQHAVATVLDAKGKPKYDVLYRRIIDPMDQDYFGTDVRTSGLVIDYAQSKDDQQIHPMSIWNMRYDLLVDYATDKGDLLPEWMERDSILPGFKTAYAIAYLLPGNGAAVLDLLNEATTITNNGYAMKFDRVLLSRVGHSVTSFDTDGPIMLPIYVPAGVASVTAGKWTSITTEIFTAEVTTNTMSQRIMVPNSIKIIDQNTINANAENGTIAFPSSSVNRMIYLFVTGTVPAGLSCSNAPVGTDLITGPFTNGVANISINGANLGPQEYQAFVTEGLIRRNANFVAGGEIIVRLSESTFDDETVQHGQTEFDYQATPIGKYIKLTSEFKRYT